MEKFIDVNRFQQLAVGTINLPHFFNFICRFLKIILKFLFALFFLTNNLTTTTKA